MRKRFFLGLVLIIFVTACYFFLNKPKKQISDNNTEFGPQTSETNSTQMKLESSEFRENQEIPSKYTCDSENVSPPLTISEVPVQAKSLALVVDDPDAPGGDWVHWLIWNINPNTTQIEEVKIPEGATQGMNDFGKQKYGGPCPPKGTHRYNFRLYALDSLLNLPGSITKAEFMKVINSHVLDQAILVGKYTKK